MRKTLLVVLLFITVSSHAQQRIGKSFEEVYQEWKHTDMSIESTVQGNQYIMVPLQQVYLVYNFDEDHICNETQIWVSDNSVANEYIRFYNDHYSRVIGSSNEWVADFNGISYSVSCSSMPTIEITIFYWKKFE